MSNCEYEYVELVERRKVLSPHERFMLERAGRLEKAHQSYLRIMQQFVRPDKSATNRMFRALRRENMRKHDAAARNAPARMVANMLDNWPSWYPAHLKPTQRQAENDAKKITALKARRSRIRFN